MAKQSLTDKIVADLQPKDKPYEISDIVLHLSR